MKKKSFTSMVKCILFGQSPRWRITIDEAIKQARDKAIPAGIVRERIRDEDSLLNTRTNIFLIVNGIGLVAVGLNKPMISPLLLCLLMAFIDLLWFLCSRQSLALLSALTKLLRSVDPDDAVEGLIQGILGGGRKHWIRPTTILAVYLPLFKLTFWTGWSVFMLIKST